MSSFSFRGHGFHPAPAAGDSSSPVGDETASCVATRECARPAPAGGATAAAAAGGARPAEEVEEGAAVLLNRKQYNLFTQKKS